MSHSFEMISIGKNSATKKKKIDYETYDEGKKYKTNYRLPVFIT